METRTGTPLTGLQTTFAINRTKNANYSATQGAKYTQSVLNSHGTQTNRPTSTPSPTFTPRPTATPIPQPPLLGYDLIWIDDGKIMRWDTYTRETGVFVGEGEDAVIQVVGVVKDYKLSKNGMMAVTIEGGEDELLYLGVIDISQRSHKQISPVHSRKYGHTFSISSNGEWIAFTNRFMVETKENTEEWDIYHYEIIIVNVENGEEIRLGTCSNTLLRWLNCNTTPIWSTDDQFIAWRGEGGLWVSNLLGEKWLVKSDGTGPSWEDNYFIKPLNWSPIGRFVLVDIILWEGFSHGLVDANLNMFEEIPETHQSAGTGRSLTQWLDDGRLIVIWFPYNTPQIHNVELYIYKMSYVGNPLLIEHHQRELEINSTEYVHFGFQISEDKFAFVTSEDEDIEFQALDQPLVRIHFLDLLNLSLTGTELIRFEDKDDYGWLRDFFLSPDVEWLLIQESRKIFLVATDGSAAFDVTALFDEEACCFQWIEHNQSHP